MITVLQRAAFLLVLVMLTGCTNFLFQPMRVHFMTPDVLGAEYEDIYIKTSDDISLHGWKLLAEGNISGNILYFHGNAENISTHFANVRWLTKHGFNVYLFDYRGYGKSEGVSQLDAIISDMESMIGYTVKQIPEDEKLAIIGHSLGGSLAIYGVAKTSYRNRIKVLMTVEAFSDYRDATQDVLSLNWFTWAFQWPLSFTVDNSYRPINVAGEIAPIPLVLVHSTQDRILPFYHGEALYAVAEEPKKLKPVEGAHNHVFNLSENRRVMLKYLEKYK
jgi:fermentation-respiration switch protein FrsA (DUF1100 family)